MADQNQLYEQFHQIAHNLRQCLYVIGISTEMLKDVRADEGKFAEMCESIDRERDEAAKLIDELLQAARAMIH